MDQQLLEVIAGFGPVGIAAAAIFWIFIKTSKRLDDLTDNFQKQLKEQSQQLAAQGEEIKNQKKIIDRILDALSPAQVTKILRQ